MSFILPNRLTKSGKWAFFISLMLVFSLSSKYRISILGLLVHPYLFILPLAVIFSGLKISELPRKVLGPLLVFIMIFFLSNLRNSSPLSESFKLVASVATFIFFALSTRSEKDFRTISWGFILCAISIAVQGYLIGEAGEVSRLSGINALEGLGNKNAQSLFTLPAIFLTIFLILKYVSEKKLLYYLITLTALFVILISLFLSANRSGWVGLIVISIVFILFIGINFRLILMVITIGGIIYVAMYQFAKDIVEHKKQQTEQGYGSDRGRQMLAIQSLSIGMENPFFGVGTDELHKEMASRVLVSSSRYKSVNTHFLWGYLFGGSGFFALLFFLLFLYSLTYKYFKPWPIRFERLLSRLRLLVVGFVILFFIRALFTHEILFSPTFMGVMGLLFGYYLMQIKNAILLTK